MSDEHAERTADTREARQTALRLRAAYMYFVEGMTQSEVSEALELGRVTVVRMLNDARARGEVRFWIAGELAECAALERRLERTLGLERAVVCPAPADPTHTEKVIGFATGMTLSDMAFDGMRIGVGWGKTLHHSLTTLSRPGLTGVHVVSLLGGIVHARSPNPSEFAWRVAAALDGECLLLTAPAIVDGPGTRTALFERCGLDAVLREASSLDIALVSVGAMGPDATAISHAREMLGRDVRQELLAAGAVGDLFFNYFDANGRLVEHDINHRTMSVSVATVRSAAKRVLASGGLDKTAAIRAACGMIETSVLITDEPTARALLAVRDPAAGSTARSRELTQPNSAGGHRVEPATGKPAAAGRSRKSR